MYSHIPTNIITGFLGVGKTTAILHLLASKPQGENWAVLVNEFGEIGVDAGLMGKEASGQEVFIKEVPGGCMCCTAGLPMQIALNQLIKQATPDRILIEPTGLGHPFEIISTLLRPEYQPVLDLRCTITLVDARNINDQRYTSHETFNQQLLVADRIVANKMDLYGDDELIKLKDYLDQLGSEADLSSVCNGQLDIRWLKGDTVHKTAADSVSEEIQINTFAELDLFTWPESGYIHKENKGEGYFSSGWRFSPEFEFNFKKLEGLLTGVDAERLKAVMITDEGIFAYNMAEGVLKVQALDEVMESRIEVIGTDPVAWKGLEQQLIASAERLAS